MPVRIQRKRTTGWTMPENTVYVGRPSLWGNPHDWRKLGASKAVRMFRNDMDDALGHPLGGVAMRSALRGLRGKNLACWCPLESPCHADVLLELANAPTAPASEG